MWNYLRTDCHHCSLFVFTHSLTKLLSLWSGGNLSTVPQHQNSRIRTWIGVSKEIFRTYMKSDRQSPTPENHLQQQKQFSNELIKECETLVHDSETFIDRIKKLEQKIDESKDSNGSCYVVLSKE